MTGLIGWWPLHEDSGDKAYDLSGNGNHGSLNGGVTKGVAGKGGLTSYSFDGNDDYISLSSYSTFSSATISAWVYETGSEGSPLGILSNNYLAFRTRSGGEVEFEMNSNSSISKNVSSGNWYHLVGTWDGNKQEFYVDGVLVGSNSVSSMENKGEGDSIGRRSNVSGYERFFGGNICDIRIYDRALTSSEIQTLYNWGSGNYARPLDDSNSSSAVSRWALDGDVTDSWASNDGTVNGGLSWSEDAIRGQASSFDGSNDYIEVSDNSSLDNSNITYSFWMNTRGFRGSGTWNMIVDKHGAPFVAIKSGEVLSARVKVGGTNYNFDGPSISTNNWYHVVLTYDGSEAVLYLNGDRTASNSSMSGDLDTNSDNLHIGTFFNRDSKYFFDGLIDDVRIYDKALSPEEIFELYRWGTRGRDMRKFTVNSRGL